MGMFDNQVVVVTGGGSGIGQTSCFQFAREGASVVVSDIDEQSAQRTAQHINDQGGKAAWIRTDVSNPGDCQAMVEHALDTYGRLDIAFNNAGIGGESNPTADYSIEGWQRLIGVNLSGVFYCMKFEIPAMLRSDGGAIVNMASILATVGFENSPAYVSSKHGVIGLSQNAAIEYGRHGIRVNAIGPGFIRTPMIASLEENPQAYQALVAMHPIGRLGEPQEVSELVVWLCSDKASFVTGAYYPVDGGFLAR